MHLASPAICSTASKQNIPPPHPGNKDARDAQHYFQLVPAEVSGTTPCWLKSQNPQKFALHYKELLEIKQTAKREMIFRLDCGQFLPYVSEVGPRRDTPGLYTLTTQHSREGRVCAPGAEKHSPGGHRPLPVSSWKSSERGGHCSGFGLLMSCTSTPG